MLFSSKVYAVDNAYYDFTKDLRSSYERIMKLDIKKANQELILAKTKSPENLSPYHLDNYIDFIELVISEDRELYIKKLGERENRIDLLKKANPDSPYHLFALGEIYLQWAIIKLKYQDYYSGFRDVSRAYKYFERNQRAYPNFILNNKGLGTIQTLVGAIPKNLRWGAKLLGGLEGDVNNGLRLLSEVYHNLEDDQIFKQEVGIIYAYLLLHYGNMKDDAWHIIESLDLDDLNPIHLYIKSNIAHYTGRDDLAIEILSQYSPKDSTLQFDYLDYIMGVVKLNRLDPDADYYLQRYVENFKGQNYKKDAYLRLSWSALIKEDYSLYREFNSKIIENGTEIINYDKIAQRMAESDFKPNTNLLKARLLFDGGYYHKVDELLTDLKKYEFERKLDRLEYTYRLGRTKHQLGDIKSALLYFKETIEAGKNEESHYACNSALQLGLIYESLGFEKQAINHYKVCLSINPSDYRYSLHQKAKAGLTRLKTS